jgi:uncharacterized protein YycO
MKSITSFILTIFALFSMMPYSAYGYCNDTYQEYEQLIKAGILSSDVTFEYWQEVKENESELALQLENSSEFHEVYDSRNATVPYIMKPGDVLLTNGVGSFALVGHAAITISETEVLHIAGYGEKPATLSWQDWKALYSTYGWIKIYRNSNENVAKAAAAWAERNYKNSGATYEISMDLISTASTYCSKIVWQAYYFGPSRPAVSGLPFGIILPFDLATSISNLSLLHTYQ